MRAYVSLSSADLLEVGRSIEAVGDAADGFHIDVMDGHLSPNSSSVPTSSQLYAAGQRSPSRYT